MPLLSHNETFLLQQISPCSELNWVGVPAARDRVARCAKQRKTGANIGEKKSQTVNNDNCLFF